MIAGLNDSGKNAIRFQLQSAPVMSILGDGLIISSSIIVSRRRMKYGKVYIVPFMPLSPSLRSVVDHHTSLSFGNQNLSQGIESRLP